MRKSIVLLLVLFLLATEESYGAIEQTKQAQQVASIASLYKGVVELHVMLGERVKKGQLLFELNQDILKVQKKYYAYKVKFTKEVLEGAKKLVKIHSLPVDDLQQSIRDYLIAKSSYDLVGYNIKASKYYAPFAGTVTKIIRYDGSGLGDSDNEIEITKGFVKVDTENRVAIVCNRWPGILDLKVKLGQKVKKGGILFSIDTNALKIQKEKSETLLKYTKLLYGRRNIRKSKTVSLYKTDLAENDYKYALMNVEIDEIKIRQSTNYAPFDGTVTKIYRYSGSGNGAGKPAVDITAAN